MPDAEVGNRRGGNPAPELQAQGAGYFYKGAASKVAFLPVVTRTSQSVP